MTERLVHIESISVEELKDLIREAVGEAMRNYKPPKKKEKYLTPTQLMEEIEISRTTLHNWRKNKKLPFHRFGNKIKYLLSEVEEWAMTNRVRRIRRVIEEREKYEGFE